MESLLVEEVVLLQQTRIKAEKGHNFWSDRWIALKVLQYVPEAIVLVLPMKCLLVEEVVLSRETGIKAEKGHNFWSDRWIALKVLQYVPEAVFLVLPMESLLVEEDVMSRQTGIKAEKGDNFWSDRWIALIFFTVVFGGRFPCITFGIPTRWRGGLVEPDQNNRWKRP
jgi:branched-subunit amino acid transport protein